MVYFNDLKEDTTYPAPHTIAEPAKFVDPKIQPNDILAVTIQTIAQNETNAPVAMTSATGVRDPYSGFLVDKDGYVELSLVGFIKVSGLTTAEAREAIKQKAKEYYKDPVVNVRITNFDVTVLGDVARPGLINIPSEKASILEVLSLAGDLNITAKRHEILLVRNEGNEKKAIRLDMTSASLFSSPYFYMQQRDVLYVEPRNYKIQNSDNTFTRYFSIGTSILSVVSLLFAFRVIK